MNEAQVDTFIADIALEMETLRAAEKRPVELSASQEMELANLPEGEREERRAQYIKEANERRKDEMALLISAVEDRIKASGLPSQTIKELLNVVEQSKNADWSFSPDALKKVEDIKEKQNVIEEKKEENKQTDINLVNIAVTAATTVAVVAVAGVVEGNKQKITASKSCGTMFKPVAGLFIIDEEMAQKNPEKVAKIERIVQRAKGKIDTNSAPLSLDMIEQAQNISPFAKKCLKSAYLQEHPEILKDLQVQEEALKKKDLDVEAKKFKHECKINGNHPDRGKPENAPKYESEEEKFVMEKVVKKIKQSAGTSLTSFEISKKLNDADRAVFERYDRRIHPEFYENRDKAAQVQEPTKDVEMHQTNSVQNQKTKDIVMKHIERLEKEKGSQLSEEEIMNALHPTLKKHCEKIMASDPDFLKNRTKENATVEEPKQNQNVNPEKTDNVLPPQTQVVAHVEEQTQNTPKKSRLHRTMELRSNKNQSKKKQRSADLAKNTALVNKRKKSVA